MREARLCRNFFLITIASASFAAANAQSAAPGPAATIDVAVIRPHPADVQHNNFSFTGNRFILEDQSVFKLISFAYALNAAQVVGAPAWTREIHYDMTGTTNLTQDATVPQQQQLVRQLFESRLGLRFHHEQRELPVYAIQIVKGGPKLTSAAHPDVPPMERGSGQGLHTTQTYTSSSIADFILYMQLFQDRPLIDQTGLTGRYDFQLTYTYRGETDPAPDAPPPMFTAVQEQLGLKFQPVKALVDVLVIDHIDQPSPN